MSFLNYKNIQLLGQINDHLENYDCSAVESKFLGKLAKNIFGCSLYSLYQETDTVKYIGSHTCNHRGCNICNSQRQKRIRRKYFKFFTETPELIECRDKIGNPKVYTQNYWNETVKNRPGYTYICKRKYDLMHLTLTVRHSEKGFNGEKFYYETILKKFRDLRNSKRKFKYNQQSFTWSYLVFGGEFGIETTNNQSGFHIHIHALLFVRKIPQNRNILHMLILKHWNNLTVNNDFPETNFTPDHISNIKKGNKLINDDLIKTLDRRGATFVNLESIFFHDKSGKKIYSSDLTNIEAVQRAVLETISYHFKPGMFELDDNKTYNIDLIKKVLPHIYKKKLYEKVGCLYFEKSLSLNSESIQEDFTESKELSEDQQTDGNFYIVQPAKVLHFEDKERIMLREETKQRKVNASTSTQAIEIMSSMYQHFQKRKQYEQQNSN